MKTHCRLFPLTVFLILTSFVALSATTVLAQGEAAVYSEDFEEGPAGWVPIDYNAVGIMWHHTTYEGSGVAWCGTDDPTYINSPGYGNNWAQTLSKTFTLPAGSAYLQFFIQFDTEPHYDFWYAEVSNDGGANFEVVQWAHGESPGGGFYIYYADLAAYADQEVVIRFRFTSDGGFSDQDGIIDTNGAVRLDWVDVSGARDEFETGLDGWVPESFEPGGGPFRLETGLGGNPTHAWAAYDLEGPHAGQFPWTSELNRSLNQWIRIGIESPMILMPPDQESYVLEFDTFRDLPLCEWVFYDFEVATMGIGGEWEWRSDIYIRYAPDDPPVWSTFRIDLLNAVVGWNDVLDEPIYGNLINPGALTMKIRLYALEYPYPLGVEFCGQHPAAPFFDNVRLQVPGGPGTLAGNVVADCPAVDTPLYGVKVVAYDGAGAEAGTDVTDPTGAFEMTLMSGSYTLSMVTPLGYAAIPDEYSVDIMVGGTTVQGFDLGCLDIESHPRSIGFWKHEVSEAMGNKGSGQTHRIKTGKGGGNDIEPDPDSPICDYLDLIQDHFNSNVVNQVVVYEPPASDLCLDKLFAASSLLNLHGSQEMISRARQQLMALLLNAAAGNIHLTAVISEDGATVSQAVTHCDQLIDDPLADHETAKTIADLINNGQIVPAGMIPLDTVQIAYRPEVPSGAFLLGNNPNPFNPGTKIHFTLKAADDYRLSIYDSGGRRIRTFDGAGRIGLNEVYWDGTATDGRGVGSGVYFSVLEARGSRETGKMTLLK